MFRRNMRGNHARLQSTTVTVTAQEAQLGRTRREPGGETNREDTEGHDTQATHQPLSPHRAKPRTPVRKRGAARVF